VRVTVAFRVAKILDVALHHVLSGASLALRITERH